MSRSTNDSTYLIYTALVQVGTVAFTHFARHVAFAHSLSSPTASRGRLQAHVPPTVMSALLLPLLSQVCGHDFRYCLELSPTSVWC